MTFISNLLFLTVFFVTGVSIPNTEKITDLQQLDQLVQQEILALQSTTTNMIQPPNQTQTVTNPPITQTQTVTGVSQLQPYLSTIVTVVNNPEDQTVLKNPDNINIIQGQRVIFWVDIYEDVNASTPTKTEVLSVSTTDPVGFTGPQGGNPVTSTNINGTGAQHYGVTYENQTVGTQTFTFSDANLGISKTITVNVASSTNQ